MYDDKELDKEKVEGILKLRDDTEVLAGGTDAVTRKSLVEIYPKIKDFIHVLTIKEIKSGKIPSIDELIKRDNRYTYTKNQIFTDNDFRDIEKKYNIKLERTDTQIEKTYSREHSLFYCYVWTESNLKDIGELALDIKNLIFTRKPNDPKISVYYDKKELDSVNKVIENKINFEKGYLEKVEKVFYEYWKDIFPYIEGKKEIKNISELKKFYKSWIKWWSPMAVSMVTPNISSLSKKHRNQALKMREDTQEFSDDGDRIFTNFINKYYPEYKEIVSVLKPEEVFLLDKRKLNNKEIIEIKKRLDGYTLINGKLCKYETLDDDLEKERLCIKKVNVKGTKSIKGQIACKGKVKGKIRLILNKNQIKTLQKGEILVTSMTSPDYITAMKKASAIITDEGGLTSHAAIVARELNKPCIIGTKFATEILKNGDNVEVDADKGNIVIL
ncbi:hypothetical protein GF386_02065 [Candidatus Pacearchaeota archaeon]|nr:hypothetical protein [Candidatus Pacearchaeota archaeon]